ncbi:Crinkler (CRN) [Phytophthora megakarya]|uniref:Crinkler (CRN) n=1 Tax=Phytophthora megakarya TaxID=4795 RepID=A0A225VLG8_9STRA|nr:Crinkler (CRN) [Phytophthora megakarya]
MKAGVQGMQQQVRVREKEAVAIIGRLRGVTMESALAKDVVEKDLESGTITVKKGERKTSDACVRPAVSRKDKLSKFLEIVDETCVDEWRKIDASVLQQKIAGVLSTKRHALPPRLLTLYLARKNEEWLKDDRHVKDFLRGRISTEFEEMRPSWVLADKELFGEDFQPGSREIHVLVVIPEQETTTYHPQILL